MGDTRRFAERMNLMTGDEPAPRGYGERAGPISASLRLPLGPGRCELGAPVECPALGTLRPTASNLLRPKAQSPSPQARSAFEPHNRHDYESRGKDVRSIDQQHRQPVTQSATPARPFRRPAELADGHVGA